MPGIQHPPHFLFVTSEFSRRIRLSDVPLDGRPEREIAGGLTDGPTPAIAAPFAHTWPTLRGHAVSWTQGASRTDGAPSWPSKDNRENCDYRTDWKDNLESNRA
jgi:hypothetical protein